MCFMCYVIQNHNYLKWLQFIIFYRQRNEDSRWKLLSQMHPASTISEPWLVLFQNAFSFIHSKSSWIMHFKLTSALIFPVPSVLASYFSLILSSRTLLVWERSLSPITPRIPFHGSQTGVLCGFLALLIYLIWLSPCFKWYTPLIFASRLNATSWTCSWTHQEEARSYHLKKKRILSFNNIKYILYSLFHWCVYNVPLPISFNYGGFIIYLITFDGLTSLASPINHLLQNFRLSWCFVCLHVIFRLSLSNFKRINSIAIFI